MRIALSLPEWFGDAEGLRQLATALETEAGFTVRTDDDQIVGFVTITQPFATGATWEITWLAIARWHHRQGLGRLLVETTTAHARTLGGGLVVVKTLSSAHPSPDYAATRRFYERMGFLPVTDVPEHWGPANPCLILALPLTDPTT